MTSSLRELTQELAQIPEPPPAVTDGGSGGSGGGSSGSNQMSDHDRYWGIMDLATQIGTLAQATNRTVFEIMREMGIPLLSLVRGIGVDIGNLSVEGVRHLGYLATALNTPLSDLARR